MNKNGYINILFIFLIISGAGLFLSFNSVKTSMDSAQKSAFVVEAQTYMRAAEVWKTAEEISGESSECVTFETLVSKNYIEKANDNYNGYVEFVEYNGSVDYYIYMSDGVDGFFAKTKEELNEASITSYTEVIIPSYCE